MSILLIHGFTGHPSDLAPLKQAFESRGLECHAPMLPGHGTRTEDLNRVTMEDWLDCVRQYDSEVLVGLSMGGLLSTILAAEKPRQKLILLSPAFFLQTAGKLGALAARLGLYHLISSTPKTAGSDIADPVARAKSQSYPAVSLKGLVEFDRTRRKAMEALPQVKGPVYGFFGAQDHTVDVAKSSKLIKNPVIFERSAHVLPLDYDQKELIAQCLKILEE